MKCLFRTALLALLLALLGAGGFYAWHRFADPAPRVETRQIIDPAPAPPQRKTLRLGTYNIAHARGSAAGTSNHNGESAEDRLARAKAIGAALREADLDAVALNEIDFACTWSNGIDMLEVIGAEAGFAYAVRQRNYDARIPGYRLDFGNAILSRHPVENARLIEFAPRQEWMATLIGNQDAAYAELSDGSQRFALCAVHLDVDDAAVRARAAEELLALAGASEVPLFIAGDFNATRQGSPGYDPPADAPGAIELLLGGDAPKFVSQPTGTATAADFTFPSEGPERTIDWVLAPTGTRIVRKEVVNLPLSDHCLVVLEVLR